MESTTTPAPQNGQPPQQKDEDGTRYVILERVEAKDGRTAWTEVDKTAHGSGSDAAIRKSRTGEKGAFKGVPERNWRGGLELDIENRPVTLAKPLVD